MRTSFYYKNRNLTQLHRQRRLDAIIEWTLALVIPVLIAGPLCGLSLDRCYLQTIDNIPDYIVQACRFEVVEGLGCMNTPDNGVLALLLVRGTDILMPSLSIAVYYRTTIHLFSSRRVLTAPV